MRGKLLVAGQFLLLGVLVALPWFVEGQSPSAARAAGYLLMVAGAGVIMVAGLWLDDALTPWPEPRATGSLRTDGIYGVVRHPMYTGVLLTGYGLAALALSLWTVGAAFALTLLLIAKARYEERLLRAKFEQYSAYGERVPRFLPRIWGK
jgi:protein-S-isoprenylcysteine O-methyltransferase Ste14